MISQMPATCRATRIQILQVEDCPLAGRLIDDVETSLAAAGVDEPVEVLVGDYPSPTLVIDGVDVVTGEAVAGWPRCRLDLPSRAQIDAAVGTLRR
jgi:hypothetical protein